MYLPATFIYQDLKKCDFKDSLITKYQFTPNFQQAFVHPESGNYVMKYSIGQAIVFSPFFFIAHIWAQSSEQYLADGFSFPYQFSISMGALLVAIIGLFYLRKVLLFYFNDTAVGLTILGIIIGSNYLNYTAIDGAMTHNSLFTIYTLLIYLTIKFYTKPSFLKAIGIGSLVGFAALIRPTEIIALLIPIFWGVQFFNKEAIAKRFQFLWQSKNYIISAILICISIGSIQLFYWKYVAGEWLVYSYEDQGFSWLSPHIYKGLFSYRCGWLMYSPFMIFSIIGFYHLYKKELSLFFVCSAFSAIFIYIAFAWDIWWYGGSLGQRTMVQAYPVLAFPLAAFFSNTKKLKWYINTIIFSLMFLLMYINLWFTHQAHKGGLFHVEQMRQAYYWSTLLTYKKNPEHLKLLDGVEKIYLGKKKNMITLFEDSTYKASLNKETQRTKEVMVPLKNINTEFDWISISAKFFIQQKEWNFWQMTHFIVEVKNDEELIDDYMIRVQRHLHDGQTKRLSIDIPKPKSVYTHLLIKFFNAEGDKPIEIKNLKVIQFDEA